MQQDGVGLRSRAVRAAVSCGWFLTAVCSGQTAATTERTVPSDADILRRSLRGFVSEPSAPMDPTIRYFASFVDLNRDGVKEAVVYLFGDTYCGSGGCLTLILSRKADAYSVVTAVTISRPPIRVLNSSSHDWRDLSVWVRGGGILPGYQALLKFDGAKYPANPSVPPARRLSRETTGKVVVPAEYADKSELLYP
jgi:hypothetical protein